MKRHSDVKQKLFDIVFEIVYDMITTKEHYA